MTTFHDFTARTADGEPYAMSRHRGGHALVVNIATECAFTPQLAGLQELHEQGLPVLGFPSDQFRQNPGSDAETAERCSTGYGVTFPLFSAVQVNGPTADPLWRWLTAQRAGVLGGRISWNFTKFLIGPDGQVLRRYAPPVPPARIARRLSADLR